MALGDTVEKRQRAGAVQNLADIPSALWMFYPPGQEGMGYFSL